MRVTHNKPHYNINIMITTMMGMGKAVVLLLSLAASATAFSPSYRPLVGRIGTTRSDATVLSKNLLPSLSNRLQLSSVPIHEDFQRNPLTRVKNVAKTFAHSMKTNEVSQWRAVFATFFASSFIFRGAIDSKLAELWTFLMTSHSVWGRMFRSDHYEWMLAVGAFSIWIHGFWFADRAVRKASEQGRVHPWRKFRLQDRFEADKHRRMIERRSGVGMELATHETESPLATKQSAWNNWGWLVELPVYCVPLFLWDVLAPRRHRRLAPFGAPTTMGIVGGIAGGLFLYDLLFFFGHVAMHKIPFLYRTVHNKHHKTQEVRAAEIVRLGLVEEVLEVGFSIVALNLLGVHPFARSIYNCVITFLLTELHSGFDFPWTPQNIVPFGLMTGSRRHHFHHRNGKHYYQKFFFHVDRLFGFFQKNDGTLNGDSVQPESYIPAAWK
jgi:sterol desaturase/sphingolipid hydroxylase (fatty acid hydroxylase superfamily)